MSIKKSNTLTDSANPQNITSDKTCQDWEPLFNNFLHVIPWTNGHLLDYVIQDNIVINRGQTDKTRNLKKC